MTPIGPEVAGEMVDVLADPGLYTFIGGSPPTLGELQERYRAWALGPSTAGETWHNWVIRLRDDGRAIGHLQATVTGAGLAADIAWVIGTPWQGRGFASEAAEALVAWLEARGATTITAHVHPGHAASGRVATNAGLAMTAEIVDGEIVWRRTAKDLASE